MNNLIQILKVSLRPVTVPIRRWIGLDKLRDIYSYVKGVNSAYEPFPGGLLDVNNSTGGFLERLIELAMSCDVEGPWLLVSEPDSAPTEIRQAWFGKYGIQLPEIVSIEKILDSKWSSQEFQYDLCRYPIMTKHPQFSVVLHQSLLEHVVDPVTVIRNLNDFLIPGGIQVIQTVNIYASEHKFPIDTLRFFPDFFRNLGKYIELQCLETFFENQSIYAVLRRNN